MLLLCEVMLCNLLQMITTLTSLLVFTDYIFNPRVYLFVQCVSDYVIRYYIAKQYILVYNGLWSADLAICYFNQTLLT